MDEPNDPVENIEPTTATVGCCMEVCIDAVEPLVVASFWSGFLDYRFDAAHDDRWIHLDPPNSAVPVLNVQRVPEAKEVKNRLHFDLFVIEPEPWIAKAESFGAVRLRLHDDDADWFQVMLDPAGNEFCICRENEPQSNDT